ncbi:hypothetical protein ATL39_2734 [Sinobaca qinghaiensis]|uniref:DUF2798 domain-containing protein n=1 Tax=Sinobaca qinghaiensis TaxID=342944 RepID=A0A419V082_9BACL|nr:hypothetical protein ATL39_2734 [Sinobaca qinghaiensis]
MMSVSIHKEARLPQNAKEGILFLLIVSFLSVNTIAPVIVGLERGFSLQIYKETLIILPFMWMIVMLVVLFIARPLVGKLMPVFTAAEDGFNARVLLTIVLNVTIISLLMTCIGMWVGTGRISLDPLQQFLHIWPRNFGIAFWIEILFAQPIARFAMKQIHAMQDRKTVSA